MLLTKRQFEILKFLVNQYDVYISTDDLSTVFKVSSRTIKTDISYIKKYTEQFKTFSLETLRGSGIRIKVNDNENFLSEILSITSQEVPLIDYDENERIYSMLKLLINSKRYISKEEIMRKFYISESTFYNDYNNIKKMLKPFNLNLKHTKLTGYTITGSEIDKRSLIAKYELFIKHDRKNIFDIDIVDIYKFIADTFIKHKYKVTEQTMQNISAHVSLMKTRVRQGDYIDSIDGDVLSSKIEYQIAKEICEHFLDKYNISENHLEKEIIFLTQNILGKIQYSVDEKKQQEINDFITDCFQKIKTQFNINFESVEKLRLFLVLHIVPLTYRIRSGTQLQNISAMEIRQQFPLANDIALYFSILFKEKYGLNINEDELSYIALYFNYGIEEMNLAKSSKRILIITDLRTSETVLLKHKLLNWFPNQIIDITFVNPNETDSVEFEDYDAIFATDLFSDDYKDAVTLIDIFPKDSDFKKINLALNGFTNVDEIIEKFDESCFYYGTVNSKEKILKILCDKSIKKYELNDDFYNHIYSREKISSTYFGDGVAIPHPLSPITNQTFISVGILKKPIKWDSEHNVNFIMLISIEKNNPKAFQLWYFISDIIRSGNAIESLSSKTNYKDFITVFKNLLSDSI